MKNNITPLLIFAIFLTGFANSALAQGSPCLDAAVSSLLQQIHGRDYQDATFQTLNDPQTMRGTTKTQVYISWSMNQQSYWLKGHVGLSETCIQATWQTTEASANLASSPVPQSFYIAGHEPAKGMGLGKRPGTTTLNASRRN